MNALFTHPWLLLLAAPLLWVILAYYRSNAPRLVSSRGALWRLRQRVALQAAIVVALVLSAAGLQVPSWSQRMRIVVAADVSPSILDPQSNNQWLQAIAAQLGDAADAELGVVVFSADAGTERPVSRLPEEADTSRNRDAKASRRGVRPGLPDLGEPATVVKTTGTDIGAAIERSRGLLSDSAGGARAIVLLSDFRDTAGRAVAAAAALSGSGIDLLAAPAGETLSGDVRVAALSVPDRSRVGRAVPIEVTVAAHAPTEAEIRVMRRRIGKPPLYIDSRKIKLEATDLQGVELRKTVRFVDRQIEGAGVETYVASVTPPGNEASDVVINNQLAAAVRVDGNSNWAVLTRKGSTLEALCARKALGVETRVFTVGSLPRYGQDYAPFEGILVDGLSSEELTEQHVKAIAEAVDSGKGLVALGGEKAFGAGQHARDGNFERLLPAYMTPEDDRTRAVLFVMDVSSSMDERMGLAFGNARKIDFAAEQLAQAVQRLKEQDRLGLITFSGEAELAAALSTESNRETFLNAVKKARIESSTDMLKPLLKAREVLGKDDSEEQVVMLLSDGIKTVEVPDEKILQAARDLCPPHADASKPRRTTLYTFGINVKTSDGDAAGEALMTNLAAAGGGQYSPDFTRLGEVVEKTFEQKKDFFVRREPFGIKPLLQHPVVPAEPLPPLTFRNRVKARSSAVTLLAADAEVVSEKTPKKNRPDPLAILSGTDWPGAARSAVLALSLDGPDGSALLNSPSGSRLLPSLLEWVEDREESSGLNLGIEIPASGDVELTLRAMDPKTRTPQSERRFELLLTALAQPGETAPEKMQVPMGATAPGVYRMQVPAPAHGIYRASILENGSAVLERFITVPYPAEYRRFGTDRSAMLDLAARAGGRSRVLNRPQDLQEWLQTAKLSRSATPLTPGLCAAALVLFLLELLLRYIRPSRT
ncbi:MAG TPA: VWA domain-containing protein [Planctomycetota bacterium]|nr:VWA domain-containing protein [Planctomycetota bacterium]